jgi:2',3'-cyclic-nucleotide 2'-phosphodiesterase
VAEYKILFLGDVVGKPGRQAVAERLPGLVKEHLPLFVIINGENSAGGVGLTPDIASEFSRLGADVVTLGNHWLNKRELAGALDRLNYVVRPANLPPGAPGKGMVIIEKEGVRLAVANLCGRVFLEGYDDPFRTADHLLSQARDAHFFLDFHAEATSEKVAMGWHLDGRATAVLGTHTHVQTADEEVLPRGTAYQTDVGMCGPRHGVLGMDREIILRKFLTSIPQKFEVAVGPTVICGTVVSVVKETGRAARIERIRLTD